MNELEQRLEAAKDNAVLQAQIWAQEARTQRGTVLDILRYFGLPERDWEALRLIQGKVEAVAAEWDGCHYDAPGGEIEIGPAIRRALSAELRDRGGSTVSEGAGDSELPGMWQRSDFEGGQDEVRGPDWKRPAGVPRNSETSDAAQHHE